MPNGTIVYRTSREKHARIKDAAHAARASMNAWLDRLVDRELASVVAPLAERGVEHLIGYAPPIAAEELDRLHGERFLENAVQQAAGVEIVEDDYLGVVCCLPSPAAETTTSPAAEGKVDGP